MIVLLSGAMVFLLPASPVRAVSKEYRIKAAYLYNFMKYIDWPDSAFGSASASLQICIMGEDNFDGVLDKALSGKSIKGRSLEIKRIDSGASVATGCHILFVSASEESRVGAIISESSGNAIATVGEVEGFAEQGGVLNFSVRGGKIKIELNMKAAEKIGLKVSGKLQQIAIAISSD